MSSGLRKSIAIVGVLANRSGTVSFMEFRRELGLPSATLSRLLKVLIDEGWVLRCENGEYSCGPALIHDAEQIAAANSVGRKLQPIVTRLAHDSGESAAYVEWAGDGFVFRCKEEMADSYHYIDVGTRNLDCIYNGFGVVSVAFQGIQYAQTVVARRVDPDQVGAELERHAAIRRDRFLLSYDKGTRFLASVGAKGGVIGISMLPRELSDDSIRRLTHQVRAAAEEAETTLTTNRSDS